MGIEPTSSAWKAEVLAVELHPPLFYATRRYFRQALSDSPDSPCRTHLVEGGGFEPPKAEPADLQSAPFDRSGTPPVKIEQTIKFRLISMFCQ